jgi:hypothetical protein
MIAATLALVAYPLLGAGFVSDDWLYLAIGRHLDNPLLVFNHGLLYEYFYRPATVASWWFAERAFGTRAPGHYALSLAIHLAGALLLGALVRRSCPGIGWLPPLAAGMLFAVLPATLGTVAWLSNRNELIALAAGLAALLVMAGDASRSRTALKAVALLALALAGKETGLLFVGLAFVWLAWRRWRGETITPWLWPALLLPVLALLLLRSLFVQSAGIGISWQSVLEAAPGGILAWFAVLPRAVGGFQHALLPDGWLFVLAMAPVALVPLAIRQGVRIGPLVLGAVLLVVLPPLLQWPVTYHVLTDPEAVRHVVNLRFFHIACAGLSVLVACALTVRGWGLQATALAVVALVGLLAAGSSGRLVRDWSAHSAANSGAALALADSVLKLGRFAPGCRVLLERTEWPPGFVEYADLIVKSAAPRGHPVLACALATTVQPPWHALFEASLCSVDRWPTLTLRGWPTHQPIRRYGRLCLAAFDAPSADDPGLLRLPVP